MNQTKRMYLNFLSIELLEKAGNNQPTQEQIDLVESVLEKIPFFQHLSFNKKLSPREVSCLYWAAMGKTSSETAEILNIQQTTIEQHRQEIKKKLECKSIAEAVFKGIQFGYISQHENENKSSNSLCLVHEEAI